MDHSQYLAYMGKTLSRNDIEFPVAPLVGDGVIWNGGWAVETCVSRYVGPDYVQVNLSPCSPDDVEAFVAAGWTLQ